MSKMLGGFQFSKYTLMGLNLFYIVVGIVLICLGTQWSNENRVTGLPIIGGIVACGVFLILISILGIFAAARHHQVLLFFYMVILFLVFVIQFSVACACLSVSSSTQESLAKHGWSSLTNESKAEIEESMTCCTFDAEFKEDTTTCPQSCRSCSTPSIAEHCCPTCKQQILDMIQKGFQVVGQVSLFFSFTEIVGAFAAYRYRNMYGGGSISS